MRADIDRQIATLEAQLSNTNALPNGTVTSNNEATAATAASPPNGLSGQTNLLKSSILVVGAGGLGSPALLYLSACGVGRIGIFDHDVVELNNLHRINSTAQIVEYKEALCTSNALEIISKCPLNYEIYDIVIDATDNAPSRYLISDCCVVLGKPLVSGAAIGFEGQLTVYNYQGGPCYRCLFPSPPPTSACQRCSDSGVLGVVPGIVGCLQALEAIKIASDVGEPLSGRMLLLDALTGRIHIVKIRGRSAQCDICGENAAFSQQHFREFDYETFTQTPVTMPPLKLNLLPAESRITSQEYKERVVSGEGHVLVDVRPDHHFKIASLPNSLNIPLSSLEKRLPEISSALKEEEIASGSSSHLYIVCRRGNDSQRAVQLLHKMGITTAKDIIGGIESWARDVDPEFPTY